MSDEPMPALELQQAVGRLTAASGQMVLVTGPVGSGKTRWLRRFAGLQPFPPGTRCNLHGKPWPGKKPAATVRMLFDTVVPLWLGQEVGEELAFGLTPRPEEAALRAALEQWGIGGLDLHAPLAQLNRLQAVRLVLAGMAMAHPLLVLLDNPTASLPEAEGEMLRRQIHGWAQEEGCIVIAACNRWQDWQSTADRLWRVNADGWLVEEKWA